MRSVAVISIVVFIVSPASTWTLERSAAGGGDDTPSSPDLAGYRLCPKCNTLNPRMAEYCMRCGAGLGAGAGPAGGSKAAAIRRFVLAPMVSAGTPYYLGPRAQARFDWGRLAYEPAYAYYPLDEWDDQYNDDTEPHYLENLFRIYFGSARLRPFAAVDLRLQYRYVRRPIPYPYPYYSARHFFELTPTAGGGVNFNYDERGSFLEAAAGFGATVFWSSYHRDPDGRATFAFDIQNVTFVNRNLGIWARGTVVAGSRKYYYYSDTVFLLDVGPALSW